MYSIVLMMALTPGADAAPAPQPLAPAPVVRASAGCSGASAYATAPPVLIRSAGCSGGSAFAVQYKTTTRTVTTKTVYVQASSGCSGGEAMSLRDRFAERRANRPHLFPLFRGRGCGG